MARKVRCSSLESRSARLKLAVRRKPYTGPSLARGVKLTYRRNKTNGTWVLKAGNGHGAYWTKAIALADDYEESDGRAILTFFQAQDAAKKLARADDAADDSTAPITVNQALEGYKQDLTARNADPYNAERPRVHLSATLLAKPVQLLTSLELKAWRDSMLAKELKPISINRTCSVLSAAFELAAQHDDRIQNRQAWELGLANLPDAHVARNVILSDEKVREFVAAAYARNEGLGLLVDTLAVTGARPSQVTRLLVDDLRDHPLRPKLMMPKSGKGGGRNRTAKKAERYSVPITPQLCVRLKQAAKGRAGGAPLLLQTDGSPWPDAVSNAYRFEVPEVVKAIGLDPATVTLYALRHSSIVRMLLANVPIRLVASLHNTSTGQIERAYSKHITEVADDYARGALLQHTEPKKISLSA
jgi:integrase